MAHKTSRYETTQGLNAQVIIAKAIQYWGDGSNTLEDFVAASLADGTFSLFNADTGESLGPNALVGTTVKIVAAVKRGGKVVKSTPFSRATHQIIRSVYAASALHTMKAAAPASGSPTVGKEYGILIKDMTNNDMAINETYRYSYVAKTGDTWTTVSTALAAKINDTANIANRDKELIVTATIVSTDDISIAANAVGTLFSVSMFEEAYSTYTVTTTTKGAWGHGTPAQVGELEKAGWIFEGVTTNYPKNSNPENYGKPTSLVVSTGQYSQYAISGFIERAGKGPINQEVDKNAIILVADSNALDAARATDNIDIIFGFAAPV